MLFATIAIIACSEVHEGDLGPGVGDASGETGLGVVEDGSVHKDAGVRDAREFMDTAVVGPDAAPVDDAGADAQPDARVLVDVCDNPEDQAGLLELGNNFQSILQQQGIPCFIQSMGGPVFAMCIANALGEYVSEDCALCVGEQADCLVSNCLDSCLADQGGDACVACVCKAGCAENFKTCSGVDFGLFDCPEP